MGSNRSVNLHFLSLGLIREVTMYFFLSKQGSCDLHCLDSNRSVGLSAVNANITFPIFPLTVFCRCHLAAMQIDGICTGVWCPYILQLCLCILVRRRAVACQAVGCYKGRQVHCKQAPAVAGTISRRSPFMKGEVTQRTVASHAVICFCSVCQELFALISWCPAAVVCVWFTADTQRKESSGAVYILVDSSCRFWDTACLLKCKNICTGLHSL